MHEFNDCNGRPWSICVNVGVVKDVRKLCGVDLLAIAEFDENAKSEEAAKFLTDPVTLVDVLYVICKEQCENRKVSDEEFGRSMVGDAIANASIAMLEEIIDFFPSEKRTILRKYWNASRRFEEAMVKKMDAELTDEKVDELIKRSLTSPSNTPESAPQSSE